MAYPIAVAKNQVLARKELTRAIAERNDGFASVHNPILGDRYAYKLNQLSKNMGLAQDGRLSYEADEQQY